MPPSVAGISLFEFADLAWHVVSRLKLTNLAYRPIAFLYARSHPHPEKVSDAEFARLLGETVLSKFLNPHLDTADKKTFRKFLHQGGQKHFKADFSLMSRLFPFPGLYLAPTVTLFKQDPKKQLNAVAIKINELVLTPKQGASWELAKFFVLQGAAYHLILGFHPWVHFPMDTIIAVSKALLPPHHLLYRLMAPHMRFTLALNNRVLEHSRTIVDNPQEEVYTPYTAPGASIRAFMSAAFLGIKGNSSFPSYRYSNRPTAIHSAYGDFLAGYYEVILDFVKKLSKTINKNDPDIQKWANTISKWLPGFPDGKRIFSSDELARTIAHFIWDVSVVHATDHHNYAEQAPSKLPLRLRLPPPSTTKIKSFDPRDLGTADDMFRYKMAHEMFFKPHNITLFHDTDYGFTEKNLKTLNKEFLQNLKSHDRQLKTPRYIPLEEISRSIQY